MIEFSESCFKCFRPRSLRLDLEKKLENAKLSERCTSRDKCVAEMRKRMAAQIRDKIPKLKAEAKKKVKARKGKGL